MCTGSFIHISDARPIETPPQHFRPPSFQRLLRSIFPLACDLHLPASDVDTGEFGIQLGIGYQDVFTASSACDWNHAVPRKRTYWQFETSMANGTTTGCDSPSVSTRECLRIFESGL